MCVLLTLHIAAAGPLTELSGGKAHFGLLSQRVELKNILSGTA